MRWLPALCLLLLGCPAADADCVPDDRFWADSVAPLLQAECAACHGPDGVAGFTSFVLDGAGDRATVEGVVAADGDLLLDKPTNRRPHAGGRRFDALDPRYAVLHEFVARVQAPGACAHPGEAPPTCEPGAVSPGSTPLRRLTDEQVARSVEALGVSLPGGLFPATTVREGFRTWESNNLPTAAGVESTMLAAEAVAAQLAVDCADADCARAWIEERARQLFRRAVADDELAALTAFLDAGLPPAEAARMAAEVMLQSPQFLYLEPTRSDRAAGTAWWLTSEAIGERLSYFLVNGPPDAELAAASLESREAVAEQAARLVSAPAVLGSLSAFHHDWLQLRRLDAAQRDAERYPDWSDALWDSARTELELFVTEVVWAGQGTFDELLTSRWTWIDSALAEVYGLPDPGPGWHRVQLGEDRAGVLTRVGFLAGHAHAASSSPIRRGAFVLQELLCEELSPPQDVDMEIPTESAEAPTIRERLEQHWTDPACAACHVRIDPLGFAFEHYGALGERREVWDDGYAVDATGDLDGVPFDGAAEAMAVLAASPDARACYARKWFEYAVGRPFEEADACSVRTLSERFVASGDLRALLVDTAQTDAFLFAEPVR
jgi:hypothetical protein